MPTRRRRVRTAARKLSPGREEKTGWKRPDPAAGKSAGKRPADHPIHAARAAGLRYVGDDAPGITRRRAGKSFAYYWPDGKKVTEPDELRRIKALAIPPAWTAVWVCPTDRGHVQAVGRDARGRKQYRYHARWREVRDEAKYGRTIAFAQALPRIRRRVEKDLARPGLPREKVLAAVVKLLETTLIRVGNDEYAKGNNSYGLTTMQDRHAKVQGSTVEFRFRGKHGIQHTIDLNDARLAKVIKRSQELPGQELLQYVDGDGQVRDVTSGDVNDYLRSAAGEEFTAKDFRTWAGTVLAAQAFREMGVGAPPATEAGVKKNVVRAVEAVAKRLGNTVAVCRKCYIHPAVIDAYLEGTLLDTLSQRAGALSRSGTGGALDADEAVVLRHLQRRLQAQAKRQRPRPRREAG